MGMYPHIYTGIGVKVDEVVSEEQMEEFLSKYYDEDPTEDMKLVWGEDNNTYLMMVIALDESATNSWESADVVELDFDEIEKIRHKFLEQYNKLGYKEITRNKIKLISGAFWR